MDGVLLEHGAILEVIRYTIFRNFKNKNGTYKIKMAHIKYKWSQITNKRNNR